jgi:hypothetical protein
MFRALLVFVTVLSTVRLKGKYIMQMSLLPSKTGKKEVHKAIRERYCQNIFFQMYSAHLRPVPKTTELHHGITETSILYSINEAMDL